MPRAKRHPDPLVNWGWSEDEYDICWMACPEPGRYKRSGDMEICLCSKHITELESSAVEFGYALADPPKEGGKLTLFDADLNERDEQINEVYRPWWPWEYVQAEVTS